MLRRKSNEKGFVGGKIVEHAFGKPGSTRRRTQTVYVQPSEAKKPIEALFVSR